METKRLVNPGAELLLGERIRVLDKGYIELVDYMGVDETVVAAARHSYGKGIDLNDHAGNEKLINFLMRERHTSPFEQPALVFEVKSPIFVFRQWHRHRTGKLNEHSGRYAEMEDEFYVPDLERVKAQSKTNKQGSAESLHPVTQRAFLRNVEDCSRGAFIEYQSHLRDGVAKELARIVLPLNTYSKMVWQCDLHNLLHFLKLRQDEHTQEETRAFADAMAGVVAQAFPKVWAAYEEHVKYAVTLSRTEAKEIEAILRATGMDKHLASYKKFLRSA